MVYYDISSDNDKISLLSSNISSNGIVNTIEVLPPKSISCSQITVSDTEKPAEIIIGGEVQDGTDYLTEGHVRASVFTSEPNKEKYRNVVQGLKCIAIGSNISAVAPDGGSRPDNAALFGQNIYCEAPTNIAAGYNLSIRGSGMGRAVFGLNNSVTSSPGSIVNGSNNTIVGSNDSAVFGKECSLNGSESSIAIGSRITMDTKKSSIVLNADYLHGYSPKGNTTVCINPLNGDLDKFYIGNDDFIECVIKAIEQSTTEQKTRIKSALGL